MTKGNMAKIVESISTANESIGGIAKDLVTIIQVFTDMRRECLTLESSAAA